MARASSRKKSPEAANAEVEKTLEKIAIRPADVSDGGKLRLVEDDTGHRVLIYSTNKGMRVDLRYEGDTFWATQQQIADLFGVTRANVSIHLKNIFTEGELEFGPTCKESLHVGLNGQQYRTVLYSLNAIISVGYRVGSKQGTMFRIWATDKLFQILNKGFYIDKERLKRGDDEDALTQFRQIAREIREASANSWREVLKLCKLCSDYDGKSETAREFFMEMENKLLWAACQMTAPD